MDRALSATLKTLAWRLPLLALGLGLAVTTLGESALRALLPALAAAMGFVEPAFALQHLDVVPSPAGSRVRAQVMLAHTIVVGQQVVMPHPLGQAFAWVPVWTAWQLPMLLTIVVASWPARCGTVWLRRGLALSVLLPLVMWFDLPVALTAEFWRPLMAAHEPQGWQLHVAWADFLHGGGRALLALLLGAFVLQWADASRQSLAAGKMKSAAAK